MTKNKLVTTATFGSGFSRRQVMLAATAAIGLLNARPDAAHSDERNVSDEASMTSRMVKKLRLLKGGSVPTFLVLGRCCTTSLPWTLEQVRRGSQAILGYRLSQNLSWQNNRLARELRRIFKDSMSRHVAKISVCFQDLPIIAGSSTRHGRNMVFFPTAFKTLSITHQFGLSI